MVWLQAWKPQNVILSINLLLHKLTEESENISTLPPHTHTREYRKDWDTA